MGDISIKKIKPVSVKFLDPLNIGGNVQKLSNNKEVISINEVESFDINKEFSDTSFTIDEKIDYYQKQIDFKQAELDDLEKQQKKYSWNGAGANLNAAKYREYSAKIAKLTYDIHQLKSEMDTFEYDIKKNFPDYINYDPSVKNIDASDLEGITVNNIYVVGVEDSNKSSINYEQFCKDNDVNPLDLIDFVSKNDNYKIVGKDAEELNNLYEASKYDEDLSKMFRYLYEKEGSESAMKYLKDNKNNINLILGQAKASEFLDTLSKDYDENDPYVITSQDLLDHLNITGKGLDDGLKSYEDGILAWFKSDDVYTIDDYEKMFIGEELAKRGATASFNYNISNSIGNMIPTMAIGAATYGAGGFVSYIPSITMGMSSGGNSYHQALVEGYDKKTAAIYGGLKGFSEAGLERLLGGNPFVGSKKEVFSSVFNDDTFSKVIANYFGEMGKEALEEGVQNIVSSVFDSLILDKDIDGIEMLKETGVSAFYGSVVSAILNMPGLALKMNRIRINNNTNLSGSNIMRNNYSSPEILSVDNNRISNENSTIFNNSFEVGDEFSKQWIEDNKLDLKDYFDRNKNRQDVAVEVIGKDKSAGIQKDARTHTDLLGMLFSGMYGEDNYGEKGYEWADRNVDWQDISNDEGAILFRMAQVGDKNFVVPYIPDNINSYQAQELVKFYDDIAKINETKADGDKILLADDHTNTEIDDNFVNNMKDKYRKKYMKDFISNLSFDTNKLGDTIAKIINMDEAALPPLYKSVNEYKASFINEFIESGRLDDIKNPNLLHLLTQDNTMLESLAGTDKIARFYTLFLKDNSSFGKDLSKMSSDSFNNLFNNNMMVDFVNDLKIDDFKKVLFSISSNNSNLNWVQNESIVKKISSLSADEFYDLFSYLSDNGVDFTFKETIKNNINNKNVNNLLDIMNNKFFTEELFLDDISRGNIVNNFIPYSFEIGDDVDNSLLDNMKDRFYNIRERINSSIISSSDININEDIDGLYVDVENKNGYYNLIYEMNGKEYKTVVSYSNISDRGFEITSLLDYDSKKAALEGNLKIKSVSIDDLKTSLVFSDESGLKRGLNEISLDIDGKQKSIIVDFDGGIKDLNNSFPDAKSVNIKEIRNLNSQNIKVDEVGKLYKVSYDIDGKNGVKYLSTDRDSNVLNIDKMIENNNLVGFDNIEVTKVNDISEVRNNIINIESLESGKDVFSIDRYGGNQSNVLNNINDPQNGATFRMLQDNYFDKLTDSQRYNLAKHFSSGGCEYIAPANAFAAYMGSVEGGPEIFKEKFGFDLYNEVDGKKQYNIEAIAFDMYLNRFSQLSNNDVSNINFSESSSFGSGDFKNIMNDYFGKHGIKVDAVSDNLSLGKISSDNYKNIMLSKILNNKDGFNILSASHFDLELLSGSKDSGVNIDESLRNAKIEGNTIKNIDPHGMTVTGVDDDGNLIVSSWSKKYKFSFDSLYNYDESDGNIWTLKFYLK